MSLPPIATRDEWLAARKELLDKEKELTRQRDALNVERRNLPMVEIEKDYVFDGPDGRCTCSTSSRAAAQLIIYHFMFDPELGGGCPSCTAGTDELSPGFLDHLHPRDTTYAMVSRAPLAKLERWKAKKGWDMPWYSSFGTDFNYDFGVTIDESAGPASTTTAPRPSSRRWASDFFACRPAVRDARPELLPRGSTGGCSTPIRSTPAASSRRAARTTSSTSPRSAARRTGRSRRAAAHRSGATSPTSRRESPNVSLRALTNSCRSSRASPRRPRRRSARAASSTRATAAAR